MSKVDAQRAMREARYAALRSGRPARPAPSAAPSAPASVGARPKARAKPSGGDPVVDVTAAPELNAGPDVAADGETAAEPGLCGHRSIGNKSCTRPAGHAEKNHRYK